jgi:hypothetical protein
LLDVVSGLNGQFSKNVLRRTLTSLTVLLRQPMPAPTWIVLIVLRKKLLVMSTVVLALAGEM